MTPRRALSLRDVATIFGTLAVTVRETESPAAEPRQPRRDTDLIDWDIPLHPKRPDPSLLPGGLCRRCGGCAGVDGQDGCTCRTGDAR